MSTQSVLEYASRKIGGVPRLPPVVGGSGRRYWTIAAALAGESVEASTVAGVVPQAGTGPGVVVFTGAESAVDNFYKDFYVLNTDTTPSNGLVAQYGRISDYVGATRTATIDKPWSFSAESDVAIIRPARIALEEDIQEDVTVTIPLELDLQGHRIKGKIDITAGNFCWIRGGSGFVTNGIEKTDFGLFRAEEVNVSRRDETIYALLLTEGSDLGRCELLGCRFSGGVASRRGFSGWEIKNCFNYGVADSAGLFDVGFRLVESVPGVAITFSAIDLQINSDFNGAVFYSENSLVAIATAYMSMEGTMAVQGQRYFGDVPIANSPSIALAVGSGTLTVNMGSSSGGRIRLFLTVFAFPVILTQSVPGFSILTGRNFTGSATFTINQAFTITADGESALRVISVEGTASNMTGSLTVDGSVGKNIIGPGTPGLGLIYLNAKVTGSVTISGAGWALRKTGGVLVQTTSAAQDTGAPTITISSDISMADFFNTGVWSLGAGVSVGTWTVSGRIIGSRVYATSFVSFGAVVTGGTWLLSGEIQFTATTNSNGVANLVFISHGGTASTLTVSGAIFFRLSKYNGTFIFTQVTGATAVVNVSSASVVFTGGAFVTGGSIFRTSTGATPSLTVSGAYSFIDCRFEGAMILIDAAPAGATITGPSSISFERTTFLSTLVFQTGAGTITWTGASCRMDYVRFDGLITILGTSFSSIVAWFTTFGGNSSNNSISFSGSRPTTYRMWKCNFVGRPDAAGLPEILDDYSVRPAAGVLAKGNLATINASGQAAAAGAGSVVEGVVLAATGGAGEPTVLVRRGQVFVDSDATVAAGDNCNLDPVTPTQQIQGVAVLGQRISRTLEAAGTTVAGEAYSVVNLM